MKCVICHGDKIKVMEVKEEFAIGNDHSIAERYNRVDK